jgi:hypothetical protein
VALWKQEDERFNRSEYVALSNALQGYYDHSERGAFPCFDSFYEYLGKHYVEVLKEHKGQGYRDFDIDNFLYVLRPFYTRAANLIMLLNAKENLESPGSALRRRSNWTKSKIIPFYSRS